VVDDFVNFIDFAPTFLEVAKLTTEKTGMQPVTGKSLTDIFNSEKEGTVITERDFVLVGKERHDVGRPNDQGYPVRGIIKDEFLYLRNFHPERWPSGNPETGYLNCDGSPTKTYILDTRRKNGIAEYWQINFGKRVSEELYNITEDPFCMKNLIGKEDFAEMKLRMETEMVQKLTEQGDPRIYGEGNIFDNYPYQGEVRNYYNRYMAGEKVKANWVNESDYDELPEPAPK
jgi:arylsulfatase A-like enzyme